MAGFESFMRIGPRGKLVYFQMSHDKEDALEVLMAPTMALEVARALCLSAANAIAARMIPDTEEVQAFLESIDFKVPGADPADHREFKTPRVNSQDKQARR